MTTDVNAYRFAIVCFMGSKVFDTVLHHYGDPDWKKKVKEKLQKAVDGLVVLMQKRDFSPDVVDYIRDQYQLLMTDEQLNGHKNTLDRLADKVKKTGVNPGDMREMHNLLSGFRPL